MSLKYRAVFHPKAEREYLESYFWYDERLPGLGDRFEMAVEEKLNMICLNPLLYAIRKGLFREAKVDAFPHQIVYKIYEEEKIVFVSAVYHTKRSPRKKYRK